jgi:hypothetical protein
MSYAVFIRSTNSRRFAGNPESSRARKARHMRYTTILALVAFLGHESIVAHAEEMSTFKKQEEVSLHEGNEPPKGEFRPTSKKEANNNSITLQCGVTRHYGVDITGKDVPIGHYELVNNGTCEITATIEIRHVTDSGGTTEKDERTINVPPGEHRSISFPISKNPKDLHTYVIITIKCGGNTSSEKSSCKFIQNLSLGTMVPPTTPPTKPEPITLLPKTSLPPGTTVGGAHGSNCETPAGDYVEVYTLYNVLGRPVTITFTVQNDCLCTGFIADVLRGKVDRKPGQPVGKKSEQMDKSIDVPAKNDHPAGGSPAEPGTRESTVSVKDGETITVKVGCSGSNDNTKCKGTIKDLVITPR